MSATIALALTAIALTALWSAAPAPAYVRVTRCVDKTDRDGTRVVLEALYRTPCATARRVARVVGDSPGFTAPRRLHAAGLRWRRADWDLNLEWRYLSTTYVARGYTRGVIIEVDW